MENEYTPAPFPFAQPAAGEQAEPEGNPTHPKTRRGRRAAAPKPVTPKGRGRGRAAAKPLAAVKPARAAAPPTPKRTRKTRQLKLPVALIMSAMVGLQEDDCKLLTGMVQALNDMPKGARARIIGALGKIFA